MEGRHVRAHSAAKTGGPASRRPKWRKSMSRPRITPSFDISSRVSLVGVFLIVLGAIVAIYGVYTAPERTWPSLLLDGFYITALCVAAMFFLATQRVTGARWSASLRRVPEAFLPIVPVAALLILALFFGRHVLYSWSRPGEMAHEPAFAGKIQYLQVP